MTYSDEEKSAILCHIPGILDCIAVLFTSAKVPLADQLFNAMAEVAYLPWVDSIDPPWFDWKPTVHSEKELKAIKRTLGTAMENGFTVNAIKLILKLPRTEHMSWKIHIFRTALVSLL